MAETNEFNCAFCGNPFEARTADRKRGWARFCSKSCKAKKQEKRTGQYAAYKARNSEGRSWRKYDEMDESWDGHKDTF